MMTVAAIGLVLGTIAYASIDYFGGRALSRSGIAPLPMAEANKLYGAWGALEQRLNNEFPHECLRCVLDSLGVDVTTFMAYLSSRPKFFDGSISTIYVSDATNDTPPKDMTVSEFFEDRRNEYISRHPSPNGLMTYTTPQNVDKYNTEMLQSIIFHESLHGFGFTDDQIKAGINQSVKSRHSNEALLPMGPGTATTGISDYIDEHCK